MKKAIYINALFILCFTMAQSQGISNNGSYIKISSGAIIKVMWNNGNFANNKSGILNGMVQNDGEISIQGKWSNNTTAGNVFTKRNGIGEVKFNGNVYQTIGGSQMTYFENLTINNDSGVRLVIDEWIDNKLRLEKGIVKTDNYKIIVADTNEDAISLHSVSSYINGNLRRYFKGVKQYDLPVGTTFQYELATVNILTANQLNYVDASFSKTSPGLVPSGLNVSGTPISEFLNYGYWRIIPDNDIIVDYDITVTSRGHTNGAAIASAHALFYRSISGEWQNFGVHNNATQSGTGSNPVTVKRTNAVSLYEFVIGKSSDEPLPIDMLSFHTFCGTEQFVNIVWSTASETNNDHFTISKSTDAFSWVEIGTISGAGNSNQVLNYSFIDNDYQGNTAYYRLKQTDYNGRSNWSGISSVNCHNTDNKLIKIYPNPFNTFLTLVLNDEPQKSDCSLLIYNATGEKISDRIITQKITSFETGDLPSGTYYYEVNINGEISQSGKLISQ